MTVTTVMMGAVPVVVDLGAYIRSNLHGRIITSPYAVHISYNSPYSQSLLPSQVLVAGWERSAFAACCGMNQVYGFKLNAIPPAYWPIWYGQAVTKNDLPLIGTVPKDIEENGTIVERLPEYEFLRSKAKILYTWKNPNHVNSLVDVCLFVHPDNTVKNLIYGTLSR